MKRRTMSDTPQHSTERRHSSFSVARLQQANDDYGALSAFMIHDDALIQEIADARKRVVNGHVALSEVIGRGTNTSPSPSQGNSQSTTTDGFPTATPSSTHFWDLLETEVTRVADYMTAQQRNLEFSAKALLTNVEAIRNSSNDDDDNDVEVTIDDAELLRCLRLKADELVQSCLQLQRFVAHNKVTLTDVAAYADETLNTSCCSYLARLLSVAPWCENSPNSAFVVVLSDIFECIRKGEARQQQLTSSLPQWVAPTSFERHTTKYWVSDHQLTDLLLTAVAEAPLLVYGRSGRLTTQAQCLSNRSEGDKLWDTLATPISSVYFDSPSMTMYQERLKRAEGARLLRARWYGAKPQGNEIVFLELKTHHEKWIHTKSVKERVSLREKDMVPFLSTAEPWSWADAHALVVAAVPTLSNEARQTGTELLLRMRALVHQHGLRPCVRSVYARAAFQSPKCNALRLTVDRQITMIDESQNTDVGSWCLSDNAVISNDMAVQVPYAVFEVKLADQDVPPVIQGLQDRGVIQAAHKFSKFLTGAAAFNSNKVDMLPHWADHPAFAPLFASTAGALSSCDTSGLTEVDDSSSVAVPRPPFGSASTGGKSDTSKTSATSKGSSFCTPKSVASKQGGVTTPSTKRRINFGAGSSSSDHQDPKYCSQTTGGYLASVFRRRRRHTHKPLSSSSPSTPAHAVATQRPARVEPKSYFANERTFIQWISAALLLVTISFMLMGQESEKSLYAKSVGLSVCMCALVIVLYASFVYFRRVRLLQTGAAYGYIDHVGPIILSVSVCVGITVMLFHFLEIMVASNPAVAGAYSADGTWVAGLSSLSPPQVLTAVPGDCFVHSNQGISKLEYQPSDVLVDQKRNLLLVASLQRIVAHSTAHPDRRVRTLVEIPSSNLEGLTMVGDRIFALSEGPKRTELIELQWVSSETSNSHELSVVHRWKLYKDSSQAEGITYVPDKTRRSGRLYIDVKEQVHVYNVPGAPATPTAGQDDDKVEAEPEELYRIGTLNSNVLKHGLLEAKISSMTYFEGVAYILHDNEMVVRAWDLDEGDLLAEIPLPQVANGFSREWEGFALERRSNDDTDGIFASSKTSSLRGYDTQSSSGSMSSSLIMHLALDTPAQIWSFAVQEGTSRGDLTLPSCAAAQPSIVP